MRFGDTSPPSQVSSNTYPKVGIYEYYCQDQFGALDPDGPFLKYNSKGELIQQRGTPFQIQTMKKELLKEGWFPFDKQKKKKKSYYKPVAGRKKLAEGKKARSENQGSTEFEMELVHHFHYIMQGQEKSYHVFRSPASKTPVDVWMIEDASGYEIDNISFVRCYQCKTTKDTKPPKIDKKEFEEFIEFVNSINAHGFWVDRWKKNKNVYIRRIRGIHRDGTFYGTIYEDFSHTVKKPCPVCVSKSNPDSATS